MRKNNQSLRETMFEPVESKMRKVHIEKGP